VVLAVALEAAHLAEQCALGGNATCDAAKDAAVGLVGAVVSLVSTLNPGAIVEMVAVPGVAPDGVDASAVYVDETGVPLPMVNGELVSVDTEGAISSWWNPCTPDSHPDEPHRSSTGVAVSGHGSWDKGGCHNDTARVYNCLYEWYTNHEYRRKACSPTETLREYRVYGDRTTARRDCDSTELTTWRNHVDVDVIGEADTANEPFKQESPDCRIYRE
jgi:hypothetical protein